MFTMFHILLPLAASQCSDFLEADLLDNSGLQMLQHSLQVRQGGEFLVQKIKKHPKSHWLMNDS